VADELAGMYRLAPVIVGSRQESDICEEVRRSMTHKAIVFTELSLGACAALFKRAKLVVCNDGGPLHIAVSQGVKTISVFGPVDENVYGPFPPSGDHIVLKSKISCRPCYVNFRYTRCGHRSCLTAITAQEVLEAAKTLLGTPDIL
jgi:ADP-heptose:LPS heptosyltransferase